MGKHKNRCCRGTLGWALLGLLGYTYWVGTRQRAETRLATVEPIDDPVVIDTWQRANRYWPVRQAQAWLARRAVAGLQQARVLDLGSGAGQLSLALARRPEVRQVIGVDLSHEMAMQARESAELAGAPAEFFEMDAAELTFADASFDVVVSTLTLHHLADPLRALQQVHRVLRPGGRALFFDIRRDASPLILGGVTLLSPLLLSDAVRNTGEPLASFKAAYTPAEALLLAFKAGWEGGNVLNGPFWMVLDLTKNRGQ